MNYELRIKFSELYKIRFFSCACACCKLARGWRDKSEKHFSKFGECLIPPNIRFYQTRHGEAVRDF